MKNLLSSQGALLILMVVLAGGALLRRPGLSWGEKDHYSYHRDEFRISEWANNIAHEDPFPIVYPPGLCVEIATAYRWIYPREQMPRVHAEAGRIHSYFYGIATIAVVFGLARLLGQGRGEALVSASAYALAGLAVVYSHYGTADSGLAFWFTLCIACSVAAIRSGSLLSLVAAAAAAGMSLAFKLAWPAALPLAVAALAPRPPNRWIRPAVAFIVMILVFFTATDGLVTRKAISIILDMARTDNMIAVSHHVYAWNPLMLLLQIPPAVGLGTFLLMLAGLRIAWRRLMADDPDPLFRWCVIAVVAPLLAFFLSACMLAIPFARHLLPILPASACLAGWGWKWLRERNGLRARPWAPALALLCLLIYQVTYAWTLERAYIVDSREKMAVWIRNNTRSGATIYAPQYTKLHSLIRRKQRVKALDAKYIILHESYYRRYLRSTVNPFCSYPSRERTYNWMADGPFIQDLFRGATPYRVAKYVPVRHPTPELWLFEQAWGTFPDFNGATILFERP